MSSFKEKRKLPTDEGDKSNESQLKKTCIQSSKDPDVLIVVGGKEFLEYSDSLRCWSAYFDRALSSGMKESQTRKFEFPDKDPKEWAWIMEVMAPLSKEKITKENLHIALSWFDLLCCNIGLQACDDVMLKDVLPKNMEKVMDDPPSVAYSSSLTTVIDHIESIIKYNLQKSKSRCFEFLRTLLSKSPYLFDERAMKIIVALIKENTECRSEFFGPLKSLLPETISEEKAQLLLENDLLLEMINNEAPRNLIKHLNYSRGGGCHVKCRRLADVWKSRVPKSWENW